MNTTSTEPPPSSGTKPEIARTVPFLIFSICEPASEALTTGIELSRKSGEHRRQGGTQGSRLETKNLWSPNLTIEETNHQIKDSQKRAPNYLAAQPERGFDRPRTNYTPSRI